MRDASSLAQNMFSSLVTQYRSMVSLYIFFLFSCLIKFSVDCSTNLVNMCVSAKVKVRHNGHPMSLLIFLSVGSSVSVSSVMTRWFTWRPVLKLFVDVDHLNLNTPTLSGTTSSHRRVTAHFPIIRTDSKDCRSTSQTLILVSDDGCDC